MIPNSDQLAPYLHYFFTDGSPSLNLRFVLVKDGEEIRTVVSNPGTAITSIGIRP
jgi:hypothetical protein